MFLPIPAPDAVRGQTTMPGADSPGAASHEVRGQATTPGKAGSVERLRKNYRLTKDMKDAASALDLPLATKSMTLRQIYADAPGQGAVVWNLGSRAQDAADEVNQLFREILPDACKSRSRRKTPLKAKAAAA